METLMKRVGFHSHHHTDVAHVSKDAELHTIVAIDLLMVEKTGSVQSEHHWQLLEECANACGFSNTVFRLCSLSELS